MSESKRWAEIGKEFAAGFRDGCEAIRKEGRRSDTEARQRFREFLQETERRARHIEALGKKNKGRDAHDQKYYEAFSKLMEWRNEQ